VLCLDTENSEKPASNSSLENAVEGKGEVEFVMP